MYIDSPFLGSMTLNEAEKLSNGLADLARKSTVSIDDMCGFCAQRASTGLTLTTTPDDYWRWNLEPEKPIRKESMEKAERRTAMEYTPKRILRHGPATIVFWKDGTKTIVKLSEGEEDNEYSAFTAALAIRIFGSNSKLKKMVKKLTEEQK